MPKRRKRREPSRKRLPHRAPRRVSAAKDDREFRLGQVEWILRETVATAREVFGAGHPSHARAVDQLAAHLRRVGRKGEADALTQTPRSRGTSAPGIAARHVRSAAASPVGPQPQPAVLDIRGAALYLAISRETLYKLVRSGEIPHVRIGKSIRFRSAEIDRFLDERVTRDWSRVDSRGRPPRRS